jgi:hypothetical protein
MFVYLLVLARGAAGIFSRSVCMRSCLGAFPLIDRPVVILFSEPLARFFRNRFLHSRAGAYYGAESAFVGVTTEDVALLNSHMLYCVSEKSMA